MSTPDNNASLPPAPAPQRRSSTRWLIPTLGAVAAIGIGLVAGIAIGQNTASATSPAASSGFGRQFGSGAGSAGTGSATGANGFAAGGFASGTIVSVSGDKLVVKSAAGTDVTVTATSATKVTKQQSAKLSALTAGERITAIGTPSGSNGAITARTISEGAAVGGRFGRPGGGGAGGSGGSGAGATG